MKKKNTFRGQRVENNTAEPKNGIWAPKSVWSSEITIDREFFMEQEKYIFGGSKK
jgi:hypothetical protein